MKGSAWFARSAMPTKRTCYTSDFRRTELEVLEAVVEFLRDRGRDEDAGPYVRRVSDLMRRDRRPRPEGTAASPTGSLLNR